MKVLAILLAIPLLASAQQETSDEQTRRIFAYAHEYREHLPSLECDETMLSQRVKKGKVEWEVKITATLREFRDESEPGGFKDDYTFKSVDGRRAKPHFKAPYFVYNVFANSLGIGDSPRPACFGYRLSKMEDGGTLEFSIDSKPGARDPACSNIPDDYHKTMLIDAASGAVRHVERRISPAYADAHHEIPWITVDYAPQTLGEETFWLPVRFEASDLHQEGRMIATYANFHRYTGVVKILP